jgi:hypothetical protein
MSRPTACSADGDRVRISLDSVRARAVRLALLVLVVAVAVVGVGVSAPSATATTPICALYYYRSVEGCVQNLVWVVTNRSNTVIQVTDVTPDTRLRLLPSPYQFSSAAYWANYFTLPASCAPYGPCLLAPGRSLEAWNYVYFPYVFAFSFSLRPSISWNMALAMFKFARQRLTVVGNGVISKAAKCAVDASALVRGPNSWAGDAFEGIKSTYACGSFLKAVRALRNQDAAAG